jgi:PAS domain-containing protein
VRGRRAHPVTYAGKPRWSSTREPEGVFYDAFVASPIGIALENLEGRPPFASPAPCSMLGFSEEDL